MNSTGTAEEANSGNGGTARAEGPWSDLALHSIGWKAFQDLCSQVCEEILHRPVEIFREAQDGGQDAVFLIPSPSGTLSEVGSVQCKHSSDPKKQLRLADLTVELTHVEELVKSHQAHTYIFMTSMSVDAPVAKQIRNRLRELGVKKPHVFGKQYLIRTIRTSAHLRALVPQVYGLGDLSIILDQRLIQQTRALLDHWIPKLKVYVPTEAHRKAVKSLTEHGIVLLLGNPSSGKSAIGAILSTIASEDLQHTVLNLTSPRDFEAGWNPCDPGRFFWIDDAFGSNVVRDDYVQDWTSSFRKVQAAIKYGNRFLLTSRRHIYEAAKIGLGQRNLPEFSDGRAVVDVGDLSATEKAQILYNHVNFGGQTQSWKRSVKPHLPMIAAVDDFLPGIAERLGDPAFTKSLATTQAELLRFMQEPREHLIDTINALDGALRAALVLVYVHQGSMVNNTWDQLSAQIVSELTGVALPRISDALPQLKGSFLRGAKANGRETWAFAHPTIADALTDILKEQPQMMAALLRGATIETILGNFVCSEGAPTIRDAPTVPPALDDILIGRLTHVPDQESINWSLFRFLSERVSDHVFNRVIAADPDILGRETWAYPRRTEHNPKIRARARAYRLGILNEYLQNETALCLEEAATGTFDLSFFEDEHILRLIPPARLLSLGIRLRVDILTNSPDRIAEIADDADLSDEPESHFEHFSRGLDILEELPDIDDTTVDLIKEVKQALSRAINDVRKRKEKQDAEDKRDHSSEWGYMSSVSRERTVKEPPVKQQTKRSVFDDVDS
jgi:hypothetical protein